MSFVIASETYLNESSNFVAEETQTLSAIGLEVVSFVAETYNDTWINCTTDDYVLSNRYDTISFWYKNSTVDWTFIVNSSGTLYVDGILATPEIYPVYDNGTNMFLCKTGESEFFDGSMDDFRGYASQIDAELVDLTYLGGRI